MAAAGRLPGRVPEAIHLSRAGTGACAPLDTLADMAQALWRKSRIGWVVALAVAAGAAPAALAAPDAFFVEAGRSARDTGIGGAGLRWSWDWQALRWGGQFSGGTELSLSYWHAQTADGRQGMAHLALVPLLRWRPRDGSSPWFVEAGIGLSLHQRNYEAQDARMSTRLNFYDVLAVGRNLGPGQELSLRGVHVSNGGVRRPNPGADIILLRWTRRY